MIGCGEDSIEQEEDWLYWNFLAKAYTMEEYVGFGCVASEDAGFDH